MILKKIKKKVQISINFLNLYYSQIFNSKNVNFSNSFRNLFQSEKKNKFAINK